MHPDDVRYTAVHTPWGLYEWLVMPQGGCNAPPTHQCWVTEALRHLIGKICHVYVDNIIIWSDTIEEHKQDVDTVMDALQAAKPFCNPKKSLFFATKIEFLGHVISGCGVFADPKKAERILSWPQSTNASVHVCRFLGLV
jgi:hypothetical protein